MKKLLIIILLISTKMLNSVTIRFTNELTDGDLEITVKSQRPDKFMDKFTIPAGKSVEKNFDYEGSMLVDKAVIKRKDRDVDALFQGDRFFYSSMDKDKTVYVKFSPNTIIVVTTEKK